MSVTSDKEILGTEMRQAADHIRSAIKKLKELGVTDYTVRMNSVSNASTVSFLIDKHGMHLHLRGEA